jgi:hypothetical protein
LGLGLETLQAKASAVVVIIILGVLRLSPLVVMMMMIQRL